MPSPLDTYSTSAVADATLRGFAELFGSAKPQLLGRMFDEVQGMFEGRYLDYQPIDTPYHDWEHTLQVTHCFAQIMVGRGKAQIEPALSARRFELGVAAAILHDTGYLKLRSDRSGTGAKYTFTHVLRSCAVASAYLPPLGVTLDELDAVLGAIRCTNTTVSIRTLRFQQPIDGVVGCAVATADYVGQMAARDYVGDLPLLFAEFNESDNFTGVPVEQRLFRSVEDLVAKTPIFWRTAVLPRLEQELLGLYRFLAEPYPDGRNPYLEAIEANIEAVSRAAAS